MTKAIKELKVFSLDDHRREAYEQRVKAMRDYESSMAAEFQNGITKGEQIGIKKGRQEGRQEGEEIAKREAVIQGLKMGLDAKTLHKLTKISVAEIEKMRREMDKR